MAVDVSELADGVHIFRYQTMYADGTLSQPVSHLFIKKQQPANVITDYTYWVNDQYTQVPDVRVPRQKRYRLNTLLALPSQPLRSTQFHFATDGAQPTVYPVNDLHLRFFDLYNNYTEVSGTYIDYAAGQQIENVIPLQPDIVTTIDKPSANAIQWFRLNAQRGDSLLFRLDKAATLQLFAPSGSEAMSVSRANSTKWSGIQADESGTYYVALHDVTDATATAVDINYRRVGGHQPGDVNFDGAVDIGDVVMVISVMTGTETAAATVAAADVTGDGAADIGDIVAIIDIMATVQSQAAGVDGARQQRLSLSADRMESTLTGSDLHVALSSTQDYAAFQLTVTLPEGTTLSGAAMNGERGKGFTVAVRPMGSGRYLVAGYSLSRRSLKGGDGELLTLTTEGLEPATAAVSGVVMATADGRTVSIEGREAWQTGTTGIADVAVPTATDDAIYDLQGRRVSRERARSGVYVSRGKATVIK